MTSRRQANKMAALLPVTVIDIRQTIFTPVLAVAAFAAVQSEPPTQLIGSE